MALESATYIDGLDAANPAGTDSRATADDHLRLIKASLKRTFPSITSAIGASDTEINRVMGLSSTAQDQLNYLKTYKLDITATAVFAICAGYAVSASYAGLAGSAGNATSSVFATSASSAASAAYAYSADHAGSAIYANSAANATSAVFAYSAGRAGSAVFATSASSAASAAFAYSANHAGSAIQANTAVYAISAGDYNGTVSVGQIDDASAGGQGVVELATTAETKTGTDATRAVTPAGIAGSASLAEDGYFTLPGGLTIQWGRAAQGASTSVAIAFPVAFTTVYTCIASIYYAGVTTSWTSVAGLSTTGLTFYSNNAAALTGDEVTWVAFGIV